MLYVFQVTTGFTWTFDMNLALENVSELKNAIRTKCKIPLDKQVLLINGGECLDVDALVGKYSAGTDTNPFFLFNKLLIEAADPPFTPADYGKDIHFQERVDASQELPASFETIVSRTQLALQFQEVAKELEKCCAELVHDQHLMQQGWAAVTANLDDSYNEFKTKSCAFIETWAELVDQRPGIASLLDDFKTDLLILSKVPMFPSVLARVSVSADDDGTSVSLLDWITSQDKESTLDRIVDQCTKALENFDDKHYDTVRREISQTKDTANNQSMKEIKGVGDRLFGLEQLMASMKVIVGEQGDMAAALVANQNRASSLMDPEVFPDLCSSHQRQLGHMLRNHMQLLDFRSRCHLAKNELIENIHKRLRWVMWLQRAVTGLHNKMSVFTEAIRRLRKNADLLRQVHTAPSVYAHAVVEILKRRHFSQTFLKWAEGVTKKSVSQTNKERQRRVEFHGAIGSHFLLKTLFPGLSEVPPTFVSKAPKPFDHHLPEVTIENVNTLVEVFPEMQDILRIPPEVLERAMFVSATTTQSILAEPLKLSSDSVHEDVQSQNKDESRQSSAPSSLLVSDIEVLEDERSESEAENQLQSSLSIVGASPMLRDSSSSTNSRNAHGSLSSDRVASDPMFLPASGSTPTEKPKSLAFFEMVDRSQNRSKTVTPSSSRETSPSDEAIEDAALAVIPPPEDYAEPAEHRLRVPSPPARVASGSVEMESSIQTLQQSGDFETACFDNSMVFRDRSATGAKKLEDTELRRILVELEKKDTELSAKSAECAAVKLEVLRKSRSAHSDLASLRAEIAFVRSSSITLKGEMASSLENARRGIDAVLDERHRLEEAWLKEKETFLRKEEDWERRLEESDKKAREWMDAESLMKERVRDLERSFGERMAAELEKREKEIRLEEEETRRSEIDGINLRNAHEVEELAEANTAEIAKLKTFFEYSLSLKDKSLSAAEAGLESATVQAREESEKREKAEAEAVRLRVESMEEQERTESEWRRKCDEEVRKTEEKFEEWKVARRAEEEENREKWEREAERLEGEARSLTARMEAMEQRAAAEMEEKTRREREETTKELEARFAEEKSRLKVTWEGEIEGDIQVMKRGLKEETKREVLAAEQRKEEEMKDLEETLRKKEEELEEKDATMVKMAASHKEKTQKCLDVQKAKLVAEKQQTFNEAVDRVTKEKDAEIADLKSRLKTRETTDTASQTTDTNLASGRDGWGSAGTLSGLQAALTQSADSGIVHQDQHEELLKAYARIQDLELRLGLSSPSPVNATTVPPISLDNSTSDRAAHPQSADQRTPTPDSSPSRGADPAYAPSAMSQSVLVTPSSTAPGTFMSSSLCAGGQQNPMMASTAVLPYSEPQARGLARALVGRDEEIARLNKRLTDLAMTTSTAASLVQNDKVSITTVSRGDVVLFCLDEHQEHYVVFHMGPTLHFLHSDCLPAMGLSTTASALESADSSTAAASTPAMLAVGPGQRPQWALGEIIDKEYCQAKKTANRFKVPVGTKFYRVKATPWTKGNKRDEF